MFLERSKTASVCAIAIASLFPMKAAVAQDHTTWSTYLGNADGSHYTALKQIDKSNVTKLQMAWSYNSGDERLFEFNPIVVGRTMYVLAKNTSIVALDAVTGKELWIHEPASMGARFEVHRGINYWQSKDGKDRRLFITFDNHLEAINAETGKLIASFGQSGRVDMKEGLGRDPKKMYQIQSGTPGVVAGDLIILGTETGEEYDSPPGDIRAYDVRTGKIAWTFHTIPHPGEPGYETWSPDAWKTAGGVNCWGEMSLDEAAGVVYIPLGSPTYDFYGGDRIGNTLYSDSLVALNAKTGKLIWHYQMVHHDLWDYDPTAAPQLLTVTHEGKRVQVVAVASKQGFLYVFDRKTGVPLWPVEEKPVPPSTIVGDQASPTQPFPSKPPAFARQSFTVADINPYLLTPKQREQWTSVVSKSVNHGLFTPPGETDTIEMPGNRGGANWGMTASDPKSGSMYVISMDIPAILKNEHRAPPSLWDIPVKAEPPQQGKAVYHFYCERCHGVSREGAPPAIPSLVDAPKIFGDQLIKSVVSSGLKDMPGFPDLTDNLLDSLITYLRDPSKAPGPVETGGEAPHGAPDQKRYWTGYGLQPSIISPKWSNLTAYDLNEGTIKWQVPFGKAPQMSGQNVPDTGIMLPRNGPVVTATGLIFAATRAEGKLRAYDEATGKVLWETELPAASEGTPAVYQVDGREYLVVCATSAKETEIPRDGPPQPTNAPVHRAYIAFALPKNETLKH